MEEIRMQDYMLGRIHPGVRSSTISKQVLTLYNATGVDAHFHVDLDTANVRLGKSLFSKEASNRNSDMLYAGIEDDLGVIVRPKPMAGGRFSNNQSCESGADKFCKSL